MNKHTSSYREYRLPPEIITHAARLHHVAEQLLSVPANLVKMLTPQEVAEFLEK